MILKTLLGLLVFSSVFGFFYGLSWINKKLPDLKIFLGVGAVLALMGFVLIKASFEIGNLLLSSF